MPGSRRPRFSQRIALLVLLSLGMAIGPVLAAVGELHQVAHAGTDPGHAADAHAGAQHDHDPHSHGHPHPDRDVPAGDGAPDADHASGAHGLMHHSGTVAEAMPGPALLPSAPPAHTQRLPELRRYGLPADTPQLPFRPPIA